MIYLCDTCVLIDYLRGKTAVQPREIKLINETVAI